MHLTQLEAFVFGENVRCLCVLVSMYNLVILIPLLGFLFSSLFGFYFGRQGISFLLCLGQIVSLFIAFFIFYEVAICNSVVVIRFWD